MPTNLGRYGWTVPEPTDAPAGPEQFTELVNDITATVGGIDDRLNTVKTVDLPALDTRIAALEAVKLLGYSRQLAAPPFTTTGSPVDFLPASFPVIAFKVPKSGKFKVTVSGDVRNTNTATSTVYLQYRLTPASPMATQLYIGLASEGASRVYASKSVIIDDIAADTNVTLTPQWYISSGSSATATMSDGLIIVEALR